MRKMVNAERGIILLFFSLAVSALCRTVLVRCRRMDEFLRSGLTYLKTRNINDGESCFTSTSF